MALRRRYSSSPPSLVLVLVGLIDGGLDQTRGEISKGKIVLNNMMGWPRSENREKTDVCHFINGNEKCATKLAHLLKF